MRAPAAQLRSLRLREPKAPRRSGTLDRDGAQAAGRRAPSRTSMLWVVLACLGVSAVTLAYPTTPTYDPWAWIMWGREILQIDLVTEGGPSWKPFPILFTAPFSLLGQDIAPYLWIWLARAGGLLACVMAYRMASRLIGGRGYGGIGRGCAFGALLSG